MELILLMKNNAVLKCGDLLEIARRQVQGITYDDFISKHSIRIGNAGKPSKTKSGTLSNYYYYGIEVQDSSLL